MRTVGRDEMAAVLAVAEEAGREIMAIYADEARWQVRDKADDSPVTAADLAAHAVIERGLRALPWPWLAALPMLSEESPPAQLSGRRSWPACWLVDPLDGTREFIARNGEFSVNIALVLGDEAVPADGVDALVAGAGRAVVATEAQRVRAEVVGQVLAEAQLGAGVGVGDQVVRAAHAALGQGAGAVAAGEELDARPALGRVRRLGCASVHPRPVVDGIELVWLMLYSGDLPLMHRLRLNRLHAKPHDSQVRALDGPGALGLRRLGVISQHRDLAARHRPHYAALGLSARQVYDQAIFRLHLGVEVKRDHALGCSAYASAVRATRQQFISD